jgi:2,3-bisphosphoglycerate-independent phosphoglycerate mutase
MPSATSSAAILVVLDGWGYRAARDGNAVALARTPTWDALWSRAPKTLLSASGLPVGLPDGQMGNSEVGHLNLGAGRVVMQDLVRIELSIRDGTFFQNPALASACRRAVRTGGTLHLMGLIGSGGVHALDKHLFALIDLAERERVPRTVIHALLDGRDTMPTSGLGYVEELLAYARGRVRIASMGGRYYGMDRDRRWERTELWYRTSARGVGSTVTDPLATIRDAYARGETDEFIRPVVVADDSGPIASMRDGDELICFNFRSDRMRQIVRALVEVPFEGFLVEPRPRIGVTTMTVYDPKFELPAAFPPQSMSRIMAEVLAERGMRTFRTAETEKYPHVTYFFNGGLEPPYPGEERQLVPSQKVATYDLMPEMSAAGVTEVLTGAIHRNDHELILCNYANGDMVGHSGSLPATIKAVETVDQCLARVVKAAADARATLLITADHGNCEYMIDEATGGPHTAHTTNPVPLIVLDPRGDRPLRSGGALCDVAPTILNMLRVEQPAEMTGTDLRTRGTM